MENKKNEKATRKFAKGIDEFKKECYNNMSIMRMYAVYSPLTGKQ